jgi:integrase
MSGELVLPERYTAALERIAAGQDPDDRLDPRGARYRKKSMSESTRRMYLHWIKVYLRFCEIMGHREVPATKATIHNFAVYLAETQPMRGRNRRAGMGLSPASIRQALSAVRKFHLACGEEPPSNVLALEVIEGHEAERAEPGTGVHDGEGVPAIKLPTLLELVRACPTDTYAGVRDRFMLTMGLSIMARRHELVDADWDGVRPVGDELKITITRTKTSRKGRTAIVVPWEDFPGEDPVGGYHTYRRMWHKAGVDVTRGPLFRAVDRWDHINGLGPWAGPRESLRMVPDAVEMVIARAAARAVMAGAGIDNWERLRPHGLRSGGASTAYEAGADILSIARQGGWGDHSPVVFKYIREIDLSLRNPLREAVSGRSRRARAT